MIRKELKKNSSVYIFVVLYFIGLALALNWSTLKQFVSYRGAPVHTSSATTTPETYQNQLMKIDRVWFPTGWKLSESPDKLNFGFVSPDGHTAIVGSIYPNTVAQNLQAIFATIADVHQKSDQPIRSHSIMKIGALNWLLYEYEITADGRTLVNREAIAKISSTGSVQFIKVKLVSDRDTFQANVPTFDKVISSLMFSK